MRSAGFFHGRQSVVALMCVLAMVIASLGTLSTSSSRSVAGSDVEFATAPQRLVDTRAGFSTIDGQDAGIGLRPADSTLDVQVAGRGGIPANASAVVLNVTAVAAVDRGFVTVHPAGTGRPNASNVNFYPGHNTANEVIARVGTNGAVSIYISAATHLVIDVAGHLSVDPYTIDFKDLIVGSWAGPVTVPDAWSPIVDFWVEFRADGFYSAGSSPTGAPAFYYGTNDDYPEKVYSVTGTYPDGQPGIGTIAIVWASGGQVKTVQQGSLENIRFSESGNRLQFEFWPVWHGRIGPILYDLTRS